MVAVTEDSGRRRWVDALCFDGVGTESHMINGRATAPLVPREGWKMTAEWVSVLRGVDGVGAGGLLRNRQDVFVIEVQWPKFET